MSGILDIETLRELVAKATPGPWYTGCQNDALYLVAGRAPAMNNDHPWHEAPRVALAKMYGPSEGDCLPVNTVTNAVLIVHLVNSIPEIIAMMEREEAREAELAALRARVAELEGDLRKANNPLWFYHPDHTEVCMWSPHEVVDDYYDPAPGEHVFEVECARPLPSIWCAVRVTADEDADERFTLTEHASEDEARAALSKEPRT